MSDHIEIKPTLAGAHRAAAEADAQHPSHYTPAKEPVRTEREIVETVSAQVVTHDNDAQSASDDATPSSHGNVNAETPFETEPPKLSGIKESAGGVPAVIVSTKHALREMGVVRSAQTLLKLNQTDGFDCMSCAWADPAADARHTVEYCENGAKAVADEATTKRATPEFFAKYSVAELATHSDFWLGQQGRITHPLVLRASATHYEPITWDDALNLIAGELNRLETPDEAIFYTSGRASNEAAFLYQLFVRQFGTNNLPDCSNMCHESSGTALTETIGVGKGTVTLEDFADAEAIFLIGQNPGTNHPRMLTTLQEAKRNGAKIVSINPLPETGLMRFKHPQEVSGVLGSGTLLTDLFLPVRINGDVALLKGIMKEILAADERTNGEILDREFIARHTAGFDEFARSLIDAEWDEIVESSGINRDLIKQAADIFINSRRTISCWAMGLTQAPNAVATIQEIVNLHLLRGQIGIKGAGLCPVRGHSNVQGDRTVGIWERPRADFLDKLAAEFDFAPPRHHGFDTVEAIKAMHGGVGKVFFALGGNFLSATPDTNYTADAMRRCRLTAHVSTKLNRAHLVTGAQALILPCLGRTERDVQATGEQFVSTENSMGVVQRSRGVLAPASEHLRSETWIVGKLARATLRERTSVRWEDLIADYDRIRESIERVIPGFENYNERARVDGGFYLPNAARERRFLTATNLANFTVHPIPHQDLNADQFVMMTIRSHDQFNTTIYGLDDRYRGIEGGRRVILMNREDMLERGFAAQQEVDLTGHFNGERRAARKFRVVPYDIPRRCTATYFPETNVLVPVGSVAAKSNTPTSKFVIITIEPHNVQ